MSLNEEGFTAALVELAMGRIPALGCLGSMRGALPGFLSVSLVSALVNMATGGEEGRGNNTGALAGAGREGTMLATTDKPCCRMAS